MLPGPFQLNVQLLFNRNFVLKEEPGMKSLFKYLLNRWVSRREWNKLEHSISDKKKVESQSRALLPKTVEYV